MRTLKPLAGLALLLVVGLGIYLYLNRAGRPEVDPALQQASEAFLRERGGTADGGPPSAGSDALSSVDGAAPPLPATMDAAGMPEPVTGKIERVEGNTVVLSMQDGTSATIQLVDKAIIQTLVEIKLSDIQLGDSAMIFGKRDGERLRASQVRLVQGEESFMGGGLAIETGEAVNQQAPPEPVYGIVERVDSDSFVIQSRGSSDKTTVQVSDDGKIVRQQDIQLSDLQPGDSLTAVGVKDGNVYQVMQVMKIIKL